MLDLSAENPGYKAELENYSVVQGTGKSGVMNKMKNPKVSPNGKYISLTIYGSYQAVFDKDCVAIFDLATRQLINKFEGKYYGSWTQDNRIVVCGSDDGSKRSETPGIFFSDAGFTNLTRVDKDFNDPSPCQASVSPDGEKIAFVLNKHIWIINSDGSDPHQLTDMDNDNEESFPTFSPDSKSIACWSYKTFESEYYTAIAIIPVTAQKMILKDDADVWPKNKEGYRISGGNNQINWRQ